MAEGVSMFCGIILAGGDGKRLRHFIKTLRGDALPKQFVNFIGTRSMLEHTFHRAEKLVPRERLFTVVSKDHLGHPEVRRQIGSRPRGTIIVQPENKDTVPGLLLPLMHLYKRSPESVAVVFPSDHFILEEGLFLSYVQVACRAVERDPSRLVLLGIEPKEPESEYGYILPGASVKNLFPLDLRKASRFIEKPEPPVARELILKGGLWNTMVMVFKAKTVLDLARNANQRLYNSFQQILDAIGTPRERDVVEETYRYMEPVNFSKGLLEPFCQRRGSCLAVLRVRGVLWSDWGSEQRIVSTLKKTGHLERLHGIKETRLFRIWGRSLDDLPVSNTAPAQFAK